MRSSKSRSRGKPNNRNRSVGNVANRVFDSSGPEGKVRGTPQQIIEKYNQLARDAQLANDRVAMENFQQHAEHYMRLLSEAQKEMDARREQQERENRERQAERDRRQKDESTESVDPSEAPQPEFMTTIGEEDAGLVETPETPVEPAPKRARKPRKKPEPTDAENADEASEKPARKPRARKPAAKAEAPVEDAAQSTADAAPAQTETPQFVSGFEVETDTSPQND